MLFEDHKIRFADDEDAVIKDEKLIALNESRNTVECLSKVTLIKNADDQLHCDYCKQNLTLNPDEIYIIGTALMHKECYNTMQANNSPERIKAIREAIATIRTLTSHQVVFGVDFLSREIMFTFAATKSMDKAREMYPSKYQTTNGYCRLGVIRYEW